MPKKLIEGIDYYYNEQGLMILTKEYLLKRKRCCGNKCINCPYIPKWNKIKHINNK